MWNMQRHQEIKTSERSQWRHSGVFIVNFEHICHLVLVFLLWSLSMYLFALCEPFYISIAFRFDGFRFHQFLERFPRSVIFPRSGMHEGGRGGGGGGEADLKQWNGKWISFQRWNLNYEVTTLIINELHTFFISNTIFKFSLSVA